MIQIDFDRSEKVYKWTEPTSGEVLTAPAGAMGKAQLFQAAVTLLEPDLVSAAARVIEKHPQLERATWKAVEIVANGGVELRYDGRVEAMVVASDGLGRYAVENFDGYYTCQCEHFTSMAAPITEQGNRYCKHIISMYLARITREDRF